MGTEERNPPAPIESPRYTLTVYTRVEEEGVPMDPRKPRSLGGVAFGTDELPTPTQVARLLDEMVTKWRK